MAIKDVESKCWILALFIRDDGERFLLGDGSYEFEKSQLHFAANTIANDVVEVQGNDGYLLAGQVRRPATQTFDGYVGDSSTSKAVVEQRRRAFFGFFRKNYFYTVIYVFPDGSAIQRKRGFLVDAPEVKELWQIYPKYHVALNFEDINYYYYDENADGEEIFGKSAAIGLSSVEQTGGLVWVEPGITTITEEGNSFAVDGTVGSDTLSSLQLKGDTEQTTYSGKNLLPYPYDSALPRTARGLTTSAGDNGTLILNGTNDGSGTFQYNLIDRYGSMERVTLKAGTYYMIPPTIALSGVAFEIRTEDNQYFQFNASNGFMRLIPSDIQIAQLYFFVRSTVTTTFSNMKIYPMLTTAANPTEADYEPYVGGAPSPNPDYPQEVQTVTGRQAISISPRTQTGVTSAQAIFYTDVTMLPQNFTLKFYSSVATSSVIAMRIATDTGASYISGGNFDITVGENELKVSLSDADYNTIHSSTGNRIWFQRNGFFEGATINNAVILKGEYEVNLGKNLFNFDQFYTNRASFTVNNGDIAVTENYIEYSNPTTADQYYNAHVAGNKDIYGMSNLNQSTTYTISYTATESTACYIFFWNGSNTRTLASVNMAAGGGSFTFTTPADLSWYSVRIDNTSSTTNRISSVQVELGSTATAYAPYFEPIELCKIGDYQDYFYKSDGNWYLHRAVRHLSLAVADMDNSEDDPGWKAQTQFKADLGTTSGGQVYTDTAMITNIAGPVTSSSASVTKNFNGRNALLLLPRGYYGSTYTQTYWKTNYPNLTVDFYYGMNTPTDTQITNTALVSQLDALAGATTYAGKTVFTVDGNGNLAAIMSVELKVTGGGGVLWENEGAVWENGETSHSVIPIDSIDNVYPVITITGRTVNPILTDITTGTVFSYNGTITASQVLVVDMINKTATLNGTSVIGNVTGDWLYLVPGSNRMSYTADNADAPNVTIQWQEIVG